MSVINGGALVLILGIGVVMKVLIMKAIGEELHKLRRPPR